MLYRFVRWWRCRRGLHFWSYWRYDEPAQRWSHTCLYCKKIEEEA